MIWRSVTVETILQLHEEQIQIYGGSHGLRDAGLLESAVARAENEAYYNPAATIASVAASMSFGLIRNHAFIDGNKRIGLVALSVVLGLNGDRLTVPVEAVIEAVLRVASSEFNEEDWAAWVVRSAEQSAP